MIHVRPIKINSPRGVPAELLSVLHAKLASATGLARMAYLVAVTDAPTRRGHFLAFVDVEPGAETALGQSDQRDVDLFRDRGGKLDVGVFETSDPMAARLAKIGLNRSAAPTTRVRAREKRQPRAGYSIADTTRSGGRCLSAKVLMLMITFSPVSTRPSNVAEPI